MRGFFVTGTDTGVGKTVVSAAVVEHLRKFGRVRYWKPVATGYPAEDDSSTVAQLADCEPRELFERGVRLPLPVSPHLAAREAGMEITVSRLLELLPQNVDESAWVVEGAGGIRVPLNDAQFISDLILELNIPAIVVARATLGTINHTLLTLEALRHRSIEIAGVVVVGENIENRNAIEHYGKIAILGELPMLDTLDHESLSTWVQTDFDRGGVLEKRLRRWEIPRGVSL